MGSDESFLSFAFLCNSASSRTGQDVDGNLQGATIFAHFSYISERILKKNGRVQQKQRRIADNYILREAYPVSSEI